MAEQKKSAEATVRGIRRATRKKYTAEENSRQYLPKTSGLDGIKYSVPRIAPRNY